MLREAFFAALISSYPGVDSTEISVLQTMSVHNLSQGTEQVSVLKPGYLPGVPKSALQRVQEPQITRHLDLKS